MEMIQMNYEFCDGVTHTIKRGDTLYEISRRYKVPMALLLRANPYVDVFNLQVGDTICVPANPGQAVQYPMNGAMRPLEMENQQEAPVQQPVAANRAEGINDTNAAMPMMGQKPADLGRREDDDDDDDRYDEDDNEECTKAWEKYVVQPGDTLADVMADMKGDVEDFVEKNGLSNIYMLPGVAYYICK